MLKGFNLALQCKTKRLHPWIDSHYTYHWISDVLTGKAKIGTKTLSDMLIRRLEAIKKLVVEYALSVDW